jgi:hypothetical protein
LYEPLVKVFPKLTGGALWFIPPSCRCANVSRLQDGAQYEFKVV